jgi:hypothetical protein
MESLGGVMRNVSSWSPPELAALAEGGDHAAEALVQFDGRAAHPFGPFRGVLEVADNLQRHVRCVRPLHAHLHLDVVRGVERLLLDLVLALARPGQRPESRQKDDGEKR